MTIVCPTITAENPHTYREQIERVQSFAQHLHIDLMDGEFAPTTSVQPSQLWLPDDITCDIHIMFSDPLSAISELPELSIRTLIIPAEQINDRNLEKIVKEASTRGARLGVALLADTSVSRVAPHIDSFEHALIFSGNLGHQGGSKVEESLLSKANELRSLKPSLELGWDGGLSEDTIALVAQAGISVLNVGSAIQFAPDPEQAYKKLVSQINV